MLLTADRSTTSRWAPSAGANAPIRSGRSSKARTEADTSCGRHSPGSQIAFESGLGSPSSLRQPSPAQTAQVNTGIASVFRGVDPRAIAKGTKRNCATTRCQPPTSDRTLSGAVAPGGLPCRAGAGRCGGDVIATDDLLNCPTRPTAAASPPNTLASAPVAARRRRSARSGTRSSASSRTCSPRASSTPTSAATTSANATRAPRQTTHRPSREPRPQCHTYRRPLELTAATPPGFSCQAAAGWGAGSRPTGRG
jgi:hypothetical protein